MTDASPPSAALQITVQPSGRSFSALAGESILAAAIHAGVALPYGCKDGACGSCKCQKLEGSIQHGTYQAKALSPEEEAAGWVLTCCALAQTDIVLESRQVTDERALPIKKMPVRVTSLTPQSPDVVQLRLQLPANEAFVYHAGQYIEFVLRDGARRAYSMANAPQPQATAPAKASTVDLHIRHMPGGRFTDHVFTSMKEKEILRIEGPFGSFYLRENSPKPIILLASGTGFAPIKALIEQLQLTHSPRSVVLYWGGRRPLDLYMDAWVREQVAKMPSLGYVPVVSDALPEDGWKGRIGFVHQAVLDDFADLSGYQVYACGAPMMVESARTAYTTKRNLPAEEFYADAFTSEADKADKADKNQP